MRLRFLLALLMLCLLAGCSQASAAVQRFPSKGTTGGAQVVAALQNAEATATPLPLVDSADGLATATPLPFDDTADGSATATPLPLDPADGVATATPLPSGAPSELPTTVPAPVEGHNPLDAATATPLPVSDGPAGSHAPGGGITILPTVPPTIVPGQSVLPTFLVQAPSLNIRGGPGVGYSVSGVARAGEAFQVLGRSADGAWVKIESGTGGGWVAIHMGAIRGSSDAIPIVLLPATPTEPPRPLTMTPTPVAPSMPPPMASPIGNTTPAGIVPPPTASPIGFVATPVIIPSPTPSPVGYMGPVPGVPTPTASPFPTVVPPGPGSTVLCEITPVRGFGVVWAAHPELHELLGCPQDAMVERGTPGAIQTFEHGTIIWLADAGGFQPVDPYFILFDDGSWAFYPEIGGPTEVTEPPPPGRYAPTGRFARVWLDGTGVQVRERLGWATAPAIESSASVQTFWNGRMIWLGATDRVYVVYERWNEHGRWRHFLSFEDTFGG